MPVAKVIVKGPNRFNEFILSYLDQAQMNVAIRPALTPLPCLDLESRSQHGSLRG